MTEIVRITYLQVFSCNINLRVWYICADVRLDTNHVHHIKKESHVSRWYSDNGLLFHSLYVIALGIQQQYKADQAHAHKTMTTIK